MKRTTNRNRHPLLRQGKKFFAQIPVCPEPSGCGNRPCKRPRFSDSPCRHTGMLPSKRTITSPAPVIRSMTSRISAPIRSWIWRRLETASAMRAIFDSPMTPSGNISHSRLHIVHEGDMVLAMGKEGNIFHHHHVTFRRRKCLIKSAGDFFIGHRRIGQLLGHHFRKAAGRFHKPFSFGIFPDCFYNQAPPVPIFSDPFQTPLLSGSQIILWSCTCTQTSASFSFLTYSTNSRGSIFPTRDSHKTSTAPGKILHNDFLHILQIRFRGDDEFQNILLRQFL